MHAVIMSPVVDLQLFLVRSTTQDNYLEIYSEMKREMIGINSPGTLELDPQ
jgi:hypothetical protein